MLLATEVHNKLNRENLFGKFCVDNLFSFRNLKVIRSVAGVMSFKMMIDSGSDVNSLCEKDFIELLSCHVVMCSSKICVGAMEIGKSQCTQLRSRFKSKRVYMHG